jgi:hypothetical protein
LPVLKVPVIRATFLPGKMDCKHLEKIISIKFHFSCVGDIIVDNGLGVASSNIIEHLFDIQPEARYFFHFIRLWLENNGVL